jgi:hypothetical protein
MLTMSTTTITTPTRIVGCISEAAIRRFVPPSAAPRRVAAELTPLHLVTVHRCPPPYTIIGAPALAPMLVAAPQTAMLAGEEEEAHGNVPPATTCCTFGTDGTKPLKPAFLRQCLLACASDAVERNEVERIDLAQGLASFHLTTPRGTRFRVRSRRLLLPSKPLLPPHHHHGSAVAVWSVRALDAPSSLQQPPPPDEVWLSPSDVDLGVFWQAYYYDHYNGGTLRYELQTLGSAWSTGTAECGGRRVRFYRSVIPQTK